MAHFTSEWIGWFIPCTRIPADALAHATGPTYHSSIVELDHLGINRRLDWVLYPDWHRHEEHWRAEARSRMRVDLVSFRDMVEAVAEHRKYDIFTWAPAMFDISRLETEFASEREAQATAADAKRAMLDMWGFLSWWMASIADWKTGMPEPIVDKIVALELLIPPKRGFLVSLTRDWKEANWFLWARHRIPVFYIWGDAEACNPSEQLTIVIFACYHPKPRATVLGPDGRFADEGLPEQDLVELRERFKGRCTPLLGQVFDPITGVEQVSPYDSDEPGCIARYEEELFLVPPPPALGERDLRGRRQPGDADMSSTSLGRRIGPHRTAPNSDHSSERQENNYSYPMHHTSGWAQSMADSVGRYEGHHSSGDSFRRLRSPSPDFVDARSGTSSRSVDSRLSRNQSPRRSASPPLARRAQYNLQRARTPPPFRARLVAGESLTESRRHRSEWLTELREWGVPISWTYTLWQTPAAWMWNMDFLQDGFLLVSEASQVRLRYLAIAVPSIRYMHQLLIIAIEHGIPFWIALKTADCERYCPRHLDDARRGVTKASLMNTDHRLIGPESWIAREYGYTHLVHDFMSGPSVQVSVYHSGANNSGDNDAINVHWDDLAEEDYQGLCGYVAGSSRELDSWIYPPADLLTDISRHYYHEWNAKVNNLYLHIKGEWEETPCHGRAQTRKEWKMFFHSSNHGNKLGPKVQITAELIREGHSRLNRAFEGNWHKTCIWDIVLLEAFHTDF
ncbi:hypothetical protein C8J57DRAFT_1252192 [Mycena rebaudengoi]|nr:hypothetical protein C8J57DRAFT_1252192 [Mycena rebaudengoi]